MALCVSESVCLYHLCSEKDIHLDEILCVLLAGSGLFGTAVICPIYIAMNCMFYSLLDALGCWSQSHIFSSNDCVEPQSNLKEEQNVSDYRILEGFMVAGHEGN